jgi:hypothetical protein
MNCAPISIQGGVDTAGVTADAYLETLPLALLPNSDHESCYLPDSDEAFNIQFLDPGVSTVNSLEGFFKTPTGNCGPTATDFSLITGMATSFVTTEPTSTQRGGLISFDLTSSFDSPSSSTSVLVQVTTTTFVTRTVAAGSNTTPLSSSAEGPMSVGISTLLPNFTPVSLLVPTNQDATPAAALASIQALAPTEFTCDVSQEGEYICFFGISVWQCLGTVWVPDSVEPVGEYC